MLRVTFMTAVYHVETIGSLLRPQYLLDARVQRATRGISDSAFKRLEDSAVDEAIRLQEGLNLEVITDGEQRRYSFTDWLCEGVQGLSPVESLEFTARGLNGRADISMRRPASVTDRLRAKRSTIGEEFVYARAGAVKPIKVTLPSPLAYLIFIGEKTRSAYPDPFDLFHDAAVLLHRECQYLASLGCEYIQIDAPELTWPGDPFLRQTAFPARGISPDRFADEACALFNIVTDVPNVRFGIHFCRGNSTNHGFLLGS